MRRHDVRRPVLQKALHLVLAAALVSYGLSVPPPAAAGGPIIVGGPTILGGAGVPFTWNTAVPVPYRTDGGGLGPLTNADANALVQSMFQVWQSVPTATIAYNRIGQIQIGGVDVDVATASDFNAVDCPQSGPGAGQNPIVYDADGSLFKALGFDPKVIGFAGPGLINSAGQITCASAALNGASLMGTPPPLTQDQFAAAFIHEFGHFSGLDHSQINTNCQTAPTTCPSNSDDAQGLPTMYPILLRSVTEVVGGVTVPAQKTLAVDDIAWISRLYPATGSEPGKTAFSSTHGTVSGTVFFSDGVSPAQGVNVIARSTTAPRRTAVSVVSGYLYTANRGQRVTCADPLNPSPPPNCTNLNGSSFGSRDIQKIGTFDIPVPAGSYTVEVESIRSGFNGGSSVGPLRTPIPMPGNTPPGPVGPSFAVTVGAITNVNITLLGTPPRFDAFESASVSLPEPLPFWQRRESARLADREGT